MLNYFVNSHVLYKCKFSLLLFSMQDLQRKYRKPVAFNKEIVLMRKGGENEKEKGFLVRVLKFQFGEYRFRPVPK